MRLRCARPGAAAGSAVDAVDLKLRELRAQCQAVGLSQEGDATQMHRRLMNAHAHGVTKVRRGRGCPGWRGVSPAAAAAARWLSRPGGGGGGSRDA